MIVLSFSS
ncbi:hypothetical protein D030_4074A, partial [Vibrio parahaemolyticus AQ3810]